MTEDQPVVTTIVEKRGAALAVTLGLLGALACIAFMALETYSVYRHWSVPKAQRGDDVWGAMCVVSGVGILITGAFTVAIAEDWA